MAEPDPWADLADDIRRARDTRAAARDEATLRECGIDAPDRPRPAPPALRQGIANAVLLGGAFWLAVAAGWLLLRAVTP